VDRSSPEEPRGIFLLDVVSGVKKRLTLPPFAIDILPAFSPDGRTVAFNRTVQPLGPFLYVVPASGGEPRELAPTSHPRARLGWISGGKEILFAAVPVAADDGQPRPSTEGRARASLWRVSVAGGRARLIAGSEGANDVAVSRDGGRLVYSQATNVWGIWQLDLQRRAATGDAQTRFAASTRNDHNPRFSPNGERVAFTSNRNGQYEIWVEDWYGRQRLPLTSLGKDGAVGCPRWSPDGKTIAFDFTGTVDNNVDIYAISAVGGPPRRITTSPAVDTLAGWSKDGSFIYFGSNRGGQWQVWKVPSTGEDVGNARQVTRGGGFAPIESTDGLHVYYTKRMSGTMDPQNSIWRIPVEGGDEEVVVKEYRSSHGGWDLTADGLYFVDQEPSSLGTNWVVRFQAFDRRPATEVARLRRPIFLGGPAISVSADGRWMLSTQSQVASDLLLGESVR
jgi:Tol biopolymer transport system component